MLISHKDSSSQEQAPVSALETSLVYFEDDPLAWNDMEIICDATCVLQVLTKFWGLYVYHLTVKS